MEEKKYTSSGEVVNSLTNNELALLKIAAMSNFAYKSDEQEIKALLSCKADEKIIKNGYYSDFLAWCITSLDVNTLVLAKALAQIVRDYYSTRISGTEADDNE